VFADDVVLHGCETSKLETSWQTIERWSAQSTVEVNTKKCAIIVHRASPNGREVIRRFAARHNIPIVNEYRYLGTIVTKGLKVAGIMRDIKSRVLQRAVTVAKVKLPCYNVRAASLAYQALVLPLVVYVTPLADFISSITGKKAIDQVYDHHYRAARIVMGLPKSASRELVDILIPNPVTLVDLMNDKIHAKLCEIMFGMEGVNDEAIEERTRRRELARMMCKRVTEVLTPEALFLMKINKNMPRKCRRCDRIDKVQHCAEHQVSEPIRRILLQVLDPEKDPYTLCQYLSGLDRNVVSAMHKYVSSHL
jgi:hypothetical protein